MINLSIPQNNKCPTLMDCFDLYVEGETMEGDDAWYNEKTQSKQNVKKKISYWSLPNILAIDLKRFNPMNPMNKNQILVTFPINDYDLYGIANHSGGTMGGHYFSYVKNANGKWYCYNDTNVREISNPELELATPKAYCLFYRKKACA